MKTTKTCELHGIKFTQCRETSLINLTEVVNDFYQNNPCKGSELEKDLYWFLRSTRDFLVSLASDDGCELKQVDERNGNVWGHPLLFVKLCCWLSADFEVTASGVVFVEGIDTDTDTFLGIKKI